MHIVLVNQHYWPYDKGGAGMSVRELAEGLVDRGCRVSVLSQSPGISDEQRTHNGVDIRYLAVANRFNRQNAGPSGLAQRALRQLYPEYHHRMPSTLRQAFVELKPDVLHTHVLAGVSTRIWRVAHELGIPVVHTLRDYYLTCLRGTRVKATRCGVPGCGECRALCHRRLDDTGHVDVVIGISDFILQLHRRLGYFEQTSKQVEVPNGIHAGRVKTELVTTSPDGPGVLRVGYLGRLHASKGVEVLVGAFRKLAGRPFRGFIAGSGSQRYEQQLREQIAGLDVSMPGRADPDEFLAQIDVLVVPSSFEEPFGRVILEAFAQGVPVICARRGGAQSLVVENRTGWLFEPDRPEELANLLEQRIADGIDPDMRRACLERAAQFDLRKTVEKNFDIYQALVAAKRADRLVAAE